jgi:hypothetical protein
MIAGASWVSIDQRSHLWRDRAERPGPVVATETQKEPPCGIDGVA